MSQPRLFRYRHFEAEIILLCVGWVVPPPLAELPGPGRDDGSAGPELRSHNYLPLGPALRLRRYAPILQKRCRAKLKLTNDSWRVDETYIKVKGQWMYMYRAVDSGGNTVEFMLSPYRDVVSAK